MKKLYDDIIKVDSLINKKKEEKRRKLIEAAYQLFTMKGIANTSIAEICKDAGMAKGTFYLYFKDKGDIARSLNRKLSYQILKETYQSVNESDSFINKAITMAESLINEFESDHNLVKLLQKDFVWPMDEESFLESDDELIIKIRTDILSYEKESGISSHQILVRLFSLISMIYSVCYSCIIDKFPADINTLKPEIYSMINSAFTYK